MLAPLDLKQEIYAPEKVPRAEFASPHKFSDLSSSNLKR
jgi:hypothetical protein